MILLPCVFWHSRADKAASALVGLLMKGAYLDALSYVGDYSYNMVPMFTWTVVEGTLVAMAASLPLLRPLIKHVQRQRTASVAKTYDLPRYATPSAQGAALPVEGTVMAAGGGFRHSIKGGVAVGKGMRTMYPFESDSDDETTQAPVAAERRDCRIMVRQEVSVTREAREPWQAKEPRPYNSF